MKKQPQPSNPLRETLIFTVKCGLHVKTILNTLGNLARREQKNLEVSAVKKVKSLKQKKGARVKKLDDHVMEFEDIPSEYGPPMAKKYRKIKFK